MSRFEALVVNRDVGVAPTLTVDTLICRVTLSLTRDTHCKSIKREMKDAEKCLMIHQTLHTNEAFY